MKKLFSKRFLSRKIVFLSIVLLFLFLRLYKLPQRLNFSSDQGQLFLMTKEIWDEKKLTLIGPYLTSTDVEGRGIFLGSVYIYITLLLLLIGNWQPLIASAMLVFVQLAAVLLFFLILIKKTNWWFSLASLFIFSSFLPLINYSNFIWNPNYVVILGFLAIFLIEKYFEKGKGFSLFLAGLVLGVAFQNHFLYCLSFPIFVVYLWNKKKLREVFYFFLGCLIGFSPLVLFELRNDFYNLRTILFIVQNMEESQVSNFRFSWHYFVMFFPIVSYFLLLYLAKMKRHRTKIVQFLFGLGLLFTIHSSYIILNQDGAFGMPEDWNHLDQMETVQIIKLENPKEYNIASLLSGDTRAYALRYLLTIEKKEPLGVEEYPQTKTLFVVSKKDPLEHNVWEVNSMKPAEISQAWNINSNVKLFKIVKK